MTLDELNKAFDEAMEEGLKTLKGKAPGPQERIVIAGLALLKEFLIDHKRIADAQETLARIESDEHDIRNEARRG